MTEIFLIYASVNHIRIFHHLFLIYAPVNHIIILQRQFDDGSSFQCTKLLKTSSLSDYRILDYWTVGLSGCQIIGLTPYIISSPGPTMPSLGVRRLYIFHISSFFSESTGPIGTKLSRNVPWVVLYKVSVFRSSRIFNMAARANNML